MAHPPRTPDPAVLAALVTSDPLEPRIPEARAAVAGPAQGAVVLFEGTVRDHDGGAAVASLTYTSHPDAPQLLRSVTTEAIHAAAGPAAGTVTCWVAHRVGPLAIGDLAFLVAVAAPHRAEAFAALDRITTEVKSRVPIWKEQSMADGSTVWVGL